MVTVDLNCPVACLIHEDCSGHFGLREFQLDLMVEVKSEKEREPDSNEQFLMDSCEEELQEASVCCEIWQTEIKVHEKR